MMRTRDSSSRSTALTTGRMQRGGMAEIRRVLAPDGCFVALKHSGDPNADESRRAFLVALSASSLPVLETRELREGEVACTRWICGTG